jgi:hypothetical protein
LYLSFSFHPLHADSEKESNVPGKKVSRAFDYQTCQSIKVTLLDACEASKRFFFSARDRSEME